MEYVWKPSPSFGRPIRYVILHGTGMQSEEAALERLCSPEHPISCHYFIGERGCLYQLIDDKEIAWHAGESWWGKDKSLNFTSIGIELYNPTAGNGINYTEAQYQTLIQLLQLLLSKYNISKENVLGHSDIAHGRKTDPGWLFDWDRLYRSGVAKDTPRSRYLREYIISTKGQFHSTFHTTVFNSESANLCLAR